MKGDKLPCGCNGEHLCKTAAILLSQKLRAYKVWVRDWENLSEEEEHYRVYEIAAKHYWDHFEVKEEQNVSN